ncbi:hypothetical protein G9F71_008300 [Clostridium sp. FP2]|uniref:hypothetical protein n=1 Tax=Clostridium sp. FP2 TaxID=2724481 RepID=UPI0013E90313|nr:hypothetical protein [Clostridium sp. FP2]MBZ9622852.1 hypothetical protein [Clostridium sp. FP2]
MKESIKVLNNNQYNVGLLCQKWNKHRQVKPNSFIYLNEEEIKELDSNYDLFSSGELVIDDSEINISLNYAEKNPNILTDLEIEEIFKLSAAQIKEKLSGVTELFAIAKIIAVAKRSDLSVLRLKVIEEIVGKKIDLEDITPVEEIEEVKVKVTKPKKTAEAKSDEKSAE